VVVMRIYTRAGGGFQERLWASFVWQGAFLSERSFETAISSSRPRGAEPVDRQILLPPSIFGIAAYIFATLPHYTMGGRIIYNFLGML
jgi:hypothetical protein